MESFYGSTCCLLVFGTAALCLCLLTPLEHRVHLTTSVSAPHAPAALSYSPPPPPLLAKALSQQHQQSRQPMLQVAPQRQQHAVEFLEPQPQGGARATPWGGGGGGGGGAAAVAHVVYSRQPYRRPTEGTAGSTGSECYGHGVYSPWLHECRCTAGWDGRFCERRLQRKCNAELDPRGRTNRDSLCAGNCDDDRGLCYCAGLATPFQRPLPHYCAPWAHTSTKLPDGRPAYPIEGPAWSDGAPLQGWVMANLHYERPTKEMPWIGEWARYYLKPFEGLYGNLPGNPPIPKRRHWPTFDEKRHVGYCEAAAPQHLKKETRRLLLDCAGCYEGRTGRFCELPKRMYCLRDCHGRGECDSGFCWCQPGWHGVDCSLSSTLLLPGTAAASGTTAAPPPSEEKDEKEAADNRRTEGTTQWLPPSAEPAASGIATPLQVSQGLVGLSSASPLRIYVYDMPAPYTTRLLQYRPSGTIGEHRAYEGNNRSKFVAGSLYAMEPALHEWLLDSPLRTEAPEEAHLFFVPIYAASLFMWPIAHFNDVPYYGRAQHENRRRSHQGALLMKSALQYIKRYYPFWNASGGKDHVWMMLHDEGPCFAPRELRNSILLTHYGYWSAEPKPWGTYYDDNFLADPRFYQRHIGDPKRPTPCYARERDLVIPPWKVPSFWRNAFKMVLPKQAARKHRKGLVFFAGDLGLNRLKGYSHDLRQRAYSLFCDPKTTHMRDCTPFVYGCRKELPLNCSLWEEGVSIKLHSSRYHEELMGHTFCLAFPGDGWSSRVLDAVVHGCIPVVIQDESEMFFEGAFAAAGLPFDYSDFSVRLFESELPQLVQRLKAVPPATIVRMRRLVLWVRDYFIFKDMYNPSASDRRELVKAGRPGQDAFLLLTLALENRARALGKLREDERTWRRRNSLLLDAPTAPWEEQGRGRATKREGRRTLKARQKLHENRPKVHATRRQIQRRIRSPRSDASTRTVP